MTADILALIDGQRDEAFERAAACAQLTQSRYDTISPVPGPSAGPGYVQRTYNEARDPRRNGTAREGTVYDNAPPTKRRAIDLPMPSGMSQSDFPLRLVIDEEPVATHPTAPLSGLLAVAMVAAGLPTPQGGFTPMSPPMATDRQPTTSVVPLIALSPVLSVSPVVREQQPATPRTEPVAVVATPVAPPPSPVPTPVPQTNRYTVSPASTVTWDRVTGLPIGIGWADGFAALDSLGICPDVYRCTINIGMFGSIVVHIVDKMTGHEVYPSQ